MILGVASVALAAGFPDTEGIDEARDIALLATLKLTKGYPDGTFGPDRPITRAEFCAMLVRALGLETAASYLATQPPYPDVTEAYEWAWGYINIAVTKGVIKGYPDGTFGPGRDVTEAEALTMVMRALGYKDDYLPGEWPLNYIIKGAEDGVDLVAEGFIPNLPAPRAWVASLIVGMLEGHKVGWNKDAEDFVAAEKAFGETVLSLTAGKGGKVTKVDTANKKIHFGDDYEVYDASVAVHGEVDTVSKLVGYTVKTIKKGTKVVFVEITTKEFISGKITAIDAVNKKLTIGGQSYKVVTGFEAIKNGELLGGTEQNKLVELLDTTAKAWVNTDGNVYRVDAQYLGHTGAIAGKTVTIGLNGKPVYKLRFGDNNWVLASNATLIKNGNDATWADFKVGDDCNFAIVNEEIVWLDAWKEVLSKVQVIGKNDLGTNKKYISVVIDGVVVEYRCLDSKFAAINAGDYYDLSINRSGVVYDFAFKSSEVMLTTLVLDSLRTDYAWVDGKAKTAYKLVFTDGSVFEVPYDNTGAMNPGYYLNTHEVADRKTSTFADDFKKNDVIKLGRQVDGTVTSIRIFRSVKDTVTSVDTVGKMIYFGANAYPVADGAAITLNGVTKTLADLVGTTATIKWDADDAEVNVITCIDFAATSAVISTTSDVDGNYEFLCANGVTVKALKKAVVLLDDVKASLADIVPGMKISYSTVTDCLYIEAATDTKAPAVSSVTVGWAAGEGDAGIITATIKFGEEVQNPTVFINGEQVKTDDVLSGDRVTFTAALAVSSKPAKVSVSVTVKDYAGNLTSKTVRDLEFPAP